MTHEKSAISKKIAFTSADVVKIISLINSRYMYEKLRK